MSKPSISPINAAISGWVARLNTAFETVMENPIPICAEADAATIASTFNAKLYKDCLCIAEDTHLIYYSTGVAWVPYNDILSYQADSTATTVSDAKDDLNTLLTALRGSQWMASS